VSGSGAQGMYRANSRRRGIAAGWISLMVSGVLTKEWLQQELSFQGWHSVKLSGSGDGSSLWRY